MGHSDEVERADELRRQRLVSWDEYARLLKGQMNANVGEYMAEMARGIRDRQGRLRALKDLVRDVAPGDE